MRTILFLILFIASCSSPPAPESSSDATPPTSDRIVYELHFGPFPVQPGEEGVVCLDAPGPDAAVWVSGWRAVSKHVHHANVFIRTSGAPVSKPTPCGGGANMGSGFFATSRPVAEMRFGEAPEFAGAAVKLPAATDLLWDVHFLNPSDKPVEATVDAEFYEALDHSKPLSGYLFDGGRGMQIPAGTSKTLAYSCPGPEVETRILSATAHVHAHDVLATLSIGGKEVYRSTDWAEPFVARFDSLNLGELVVPPGAGASWTCEIRNTTTSTIRYANEIQTGEMCTLYGYALAPKKWACSGLL